MLVFGFGISTDVNNLTFAVLDHDQSHESRAYLEELRGSRYFVERPPLADYADLEKRLQSGDIKAAIEIPPGFGRDIERGRPAWVGAWVDGAMPFRAETIRGYLQAMHQLYLTDPGGEDDGRRPRRRRPISRSGSNTIRISTASTPWCRRPCRMMLALFPAILMALAIVREKELGSITNLYVTPVTRLEFLLGKQLPYIARRHGEFRRDVPDGAVRLPGAAEGQLPRRCCSASLIYVTATTAYGMLISAFARTQIAALFGTAILTVLPATQFAGMMTPVSSLSGTAQIMGRAFPMSYFVPISVGTFTKGLGFADLGEQFACARRSSSRC